MSAQFLHVYIKPQDGKSMEDVEAKLDKALDWFRYAPNIYLLYTTTNADTWKARLLELVKPDGSLFISPLDMKIHRGWMSKEFWEWIRKDGRSDA